ncbi:RMD1 family protein [Sporomusa sp.]|uniref:RMD1 family protein n=1 Tax=Sporomusa sp. TaxID=2078658 RepID=UPI002B8AC8ED|nr:RMD1 family protein [Sporomusa sp.]HWR44556.1 RMD1 family protein [Sporomusa sp.]
MNSEFKAIVLCNELNLNKISQHFGISRKFKWEDFLVLKDEHLQGIVNETNRKIVYIFHFGSMVFINFQHHQIMDIVKYIKKLEPEINDANVFAYVDDYKLEINPDEPPAINNDYMIVSTQSDYQLDIVATILAKSASLDKNEIEVDSLLDRIENVVNNLNRGELGVSDEELAKMAASILSFKLNTISYIMLLDNPDITWNNEEAGALYDELSVLFELKDRYEKIRQKTEILLDITEAFSNLVHAKRGTRLEWAIIILIVIEIILSLVDMFFR